MKTLEVSLGNRSYPIYIGDGLISSGDLFRNNIDGKQVMIVSNETIAPLYMDGVMQTLSEFHPEQHIIPDGEKFKHLKTMEGIISDLLEHKFSRNGTLIALGGGVVGDITGFAAACYQRGISFIQVPTTLLAQVDSSVGGKTAVNHSLGKNMIGAFHQPKAVIIDTQVLATLDDRQLKAGLAEVIKYGIIRDKEFFGWLEINLDRLLKREPDVLVEAIEVSCRNKAEVVSEDEKESGVRALLNLGHTFGHAVETGLNYKSWLHGEAIGLGMIMAADLSMRMGWLNQQQVTKIKTIIIKAGLPTKLPESLTTDIILENMAVDKKARDGQLFLILLKDIGEAIVTNEYDPAMLKQTIDHFRSGKDDKI